MTTICCIGSSTTLGTGPSNANNAWVAQLTTYMKGRNTANVVVNLGLGGVSSYRALPTGTVPPDGRPTPDTARNITAALTYSPNIIIVNYPNNDVIAGHTLNELFDNYETVIAAAGGIPVWISTPQPRNDATSSQKALLVEGVQRTKDRYPNRHLDFWTPVAAGDSTITPAYNADGIHLNSAGHRLLVQEVIDKIVRNEPAVTGAAWYGVNGRPVA